MTLSKDKDLHAAQGLEAVTTSRRVASLTGIRAVAALLVLGTHAAYTTGKYPQEYFGTMSSRLETATRIS